MTVLHATYPESMTAVVVGEHPEFQAWLARRRAQGLDSRDEVWEGVYHVAPHEHGRNGMVMLALAELLSAPARAAGLVAGGAFNLGRHGDFRVPDLGYHRRPVNPVTFFETAALVIEVLSPGDESRAKLPFYASRGVDEVWLVDALARSVEMHVLNDASYVIAGRSQLLAMEAHTITRDLEWP